MTIAQPEFFVKPVATISLCQPAITYNFSLLIPEFFVKYFLKKQLLLFSIPILRHLENRKKCLKVIDKFFYHS